MESFLDSCVIINFLEFNGFQEALMKRCFEYIKENKKNVLVCSYVLEEIRIYIRKKEIQLNEVIKKEKNSDYILGMSKEAEILNKKDLLFAEELYENLIDEDILIIEQKFVESIRILRLKLNIFLKSIKEILKCNDLSLASILNEFIDDYADCKVLSVVLLVQQTRSPFLFVTCDKHIDPDGYNFIKDDPRLKDYKFPKLINFLYQN